MTVAERFRAEWDVSGRRIVRGELVTTHRSVMPLHEYTWPEDRSRLGSWLGE